MEWSDYVASKLASFNQEQIALRSGVSQATISRWAAGKQPPSVEKAIEFARNLGDSPVAALVALGAITSAEAGKVVMVQASAAELSDAELVREIERRLGHRVERRRPA